MTSLGQRAAGAMAWNFAGKLYFMVAKYVESIILLRMLGALENGALIGAINIQATGVMLVSLGLGNALLKFLPAIREDGGDEGRFLRRVLIFRTLVSLGAAAAVWAAAPYFAESFLGDATRTALVRAAAVLLASTSIQNLQTRILVSRYRQKEINVIQTVVVTLYLAGAVIALLSGGGVTAVLAVNAGASMVGCAWIAWEDRRTSVRAERPVGPGPSPVGLKRLVAFSLTFYAYDFLNVVLEKQLDIWMLGFLNDDLKQITYYALAYNFGFFAYSVFTKVFADGFTLSVVSDLHAAGRRDGMQRVFIGIFEYTYIFALPVVAGGMLLADDLLRLMYGSEGLGIIGPALLFLPVMAVGKYAGITANFLGAMDKERALIRSRLIFGVANAAANALLIPRYGAWGATIGTASATLLGAAYEAVLLHRAIRPQYPWAFLVKTALAAVVMGLVVWIVCRYVPDADGWRVAVGLPVGAGVYALMLVILKPIHPAILDILGRTRAPFVARVVRYLMPASREESP